MKLEKSKKVLFVTPSFRGAAAKIISCIESNNAERISVHVLSFNKKYDRKKIPGSYHFYRSINSKSKSFLSKARIARNRSSKINEIIEKERIDTVVGFLKESGVPAVLNKVFGSSARVVVAVRNNPRKKFGNLNGKLSAFLYKFADLVVTNSKRAGQICRGEYGLKNVTTIQNPVDYEGIKKDIKKPVPDEHTDIFDSEYTFINVGRLSSQKGQWHLIRAFKKVAGKHPDAKLVILGDGYLKPKLQKLIKRCGLKENVYLLGHQDNVFSYLSASDCFVLSSLHEGLPNVVLEAKTVGLPIVSTDCDTGPREIIAPKLSFSEGVSYPYSAGSHTLVPKLSGERIYQSLKQESLQPAERVLSQVMAEQINKPKRKKEFNHDSRFEPEKVIDEWIQVL
jgi:glycosyltransferase involved in cell wall biosynthesis